MSDVMQWGGGNNSGIGIPDQNALAEAPAALDMVPMYDASAASGKSISVPYLQCQRKVVAPDTANLAAVDLYDTVISNYGMADGDAALSLPTAGPGMKARFVVYTARAHKWGVKAGTNDKIYLIASDGTTSAGSDAGYARFANAVLGQCFDLWSFKSGTATWDWMAKAVCIATSTFAAA